jgi:8-oxo-dGTP diphosphatase
MLIDSNLEKTMPEKSKPDLIRAAGGLVWRAGPEGREVLVIHRARYDDWSLPKGKLKPGEIWQEAAQREVAEETGLRTALGSLAGDVFYYVGERPKVVLFWNMTITGEDPLASQDSDSPDETGEARWVRVPAELDRLSYAGERDLVRRVYQREVED